jgi:hypothetical protein
MPPPCGHEPLDLPPFGEAYTSAFCRYCWLYEHDSRYRTLWGSQEALSKGAEPSAPDGLPPRQTVQRGRPQAARLPCVYQGEPTGAMVPCGTCKKGTALKVYGCDLYSSCTLATKAGDVACCTRCESYRADTFRLVAPAGTMGENRWEGSVPRKPWQYPASACLPHLDTPDLLELAVALLRLQTVPPYLLVIDTGSSPAVCERLESMRAVDLEVHFIRGHGYQHSSGPVATALDLAHALCRTDYLYHTHCDVFLKRRDYLEWLLSQCSPECPAVGYEMSERSWATEDWRGMVSHTATMLHVPTLRRLGTCWNMEYAYELANWTGRNASGWPDTETGFNLILRAKGVVPRLIGRERNFEVSEDHNLTHVRSAPGMRIYRCGPPGYREAQPALLKRALAEGWQRVQEWQNSTTLSGR